MLLPVRSVVGEERIVVEERLRLWSIARGRYAGFEMLLVLYVVVVVSRYWTYLLSIVIDDEMEDAFAWTRCQSASRM